MNWLHQLPLLLGAPSGGGAAGGPASFTPTLVTFGLVFAIFYFLIIRPQNKRQKETQSMLKGLRKGDRVVTIGGIRGSITSVKEDVVVLKVDDTAKIQFSRSAIAQVLDRKSGSADDKLEGVEAESAADEPETK